MAYLWKNLGRLFENSSTQVFQTYTQDSEDHDISRRDSSILSRILDNYELEKEKKTIHHH